MKFQVKLTEQVVTTLIIEANNELEAMALARHHRADFIESMDWGESSVVVAAVSEPMVVMERPLLEMEPC